MGCRRDYSGSSVSSAGDFNGDGFDDLLIGAPNADSNGNNSGSTYVVFGKDVNSSPVQLSDIASGKGGFVIEGEAQNDYSGYSVSAAGDVNGDGLDDLIIGAPFDRNSSGSTYVVFGKKGNTDKVKLSDIADKKGGGFLIKGESAEDESGYSVSSAGDINRDGFADLIIGAQYANRMEEGLGADSKGKVYVVFGKNNAEVVELSSVSKGDGGFVINGESDGAYIGTANSAGDFNDDGLIDLIIGSAAGNHNGSGSGTSYVIL